MRDGATREIEACCPLYLKSHSSGEYVFDHSWAHMAMYAGQRYYPKLQCCVPFTPVTGPRILVRSGLDARPMQALMGSLLTEIAGEPSPAWPASPGSMTCRDAMKGIELISIDACTCTCASLSDLPNIPGAEHTDLA